MKHGRHNTASPTRTVAFWLATALVLCSLATAARADTRLTYTGTNGQYIISIRPGVIRIDTDSPRWQLYVERSDTLFTILPNQHSYTRMNADVAARLDKKMASIREKIETQLAQLPPDQRQAARAALAEQLPGFANQPQPVSLHDSGSTAFAAGIECRILNIRRGDKARGQVCVARAVALGLSDAEHKTLAGMFHLMHTVRAGSDYAATGLPYSQLHGLPIQMHSTHTDASRSLVAVSHAPLADDLFVIPLAFDARRRDQSG